MENLIKILEAVAWPVAAIVLALVVLIVVFRVTATKGEVSVKWKDWGFGAKSNPEIAPSTTAGEIAPPAEEPKIPDEPLNGPADGATESITQSEPSIWSATTDAELETAYSKFRTESPSYADDPEFWETVRVDRRREIGIGDELVELNSLAEQNSTWIWPLVFKARRHQRLHEFDEAERTVEAAIARSNSDNRKWVFREGVRLNFSTFGIEKSLEYIRSKISSGATDIEIASMFRVLSDLAKSDDDVFSYALLSEISLTFDRSDKSIIFNLAYNYANIPDYRLTAFQRYSPLEHDRGWSSASNNMGLVAKTIGSAAENIFFEQALELGSSVAVANLSRSLAADGYIHRAELLLEAAKDLPGAVDNVHLTDARAKITKASDDAKKEIEKFRKYAEKQDKRFTAAIRAAFLHFKNGGAPYPVGRFASEDESLLVTVDADGAETVFKVGSTTYSGRLPRRPLCYEGSLDAVGGGIFGSSKRLLILQVSDTELRALVPPEDLEKRDEFRVVELSPAPEPPNETTANQLLGSA